MSTRRDVGDARAVRQRHSGRHAPVRRAAIAQLRLRVVAPGPHAAVRARRDAVPRAGGERHDVDHVRKEREAVCRPAVAELAVAPAAHRVEFPVLRLDERMELAGANLGDAPGQLGDRYLREHVGASGAWPADRALAHVVGAAAVEIAVPGHRDAEAVAGRDVCDGQRSQRFDERRAFALVVGVAEAERTFGVLTPPVDLAARREDQRVIGRGRDCDAVAHHDSRGAAGIAGGASELTGDVLTPGEDLAVGAERDRMARAEGDRGGRRLGRDIRDGQGDDGEQARNEPVAHMRHSSGPGQGVVVPDLRSRPARDRGRRGRARCCRAAASATTAGGTAS